MRQHLWHGFYHSGMRHFLAIASTICFTLTASIATDAQAEDTRSVEAIMNTPLLSLRAGSEYDQPVSAFLRVKVALFESGVRLTLGMNLDPREYIDLRPGSRVMRAPDAWDALLSILSVAVWEPSLAVETDGMNWQAAPLDTVFPGLSLALIEMVNEADREPGYGASSSDRLSLDIQEFYNTNDVTGMLKPIMALSGSFLPQVRPSVPTSGDSNVDEKTPRLDLVLNWQLLGTQRTQSVQTRLQNQLREDGRSEVKQRITLSQFSEQLATDVREKPEFDSWHRFVDSLRNSEMEDYAAPDASLGLRLTRKLRLSIAGRDPLDDQHGKLIFAKSPMTLVNEAGRSVHVGMTVRF